jgi:putative intracellular protease/amidase
VRHLKLVGLFLRANRTAREAYAQMQLDHDFQHPMAYESLSPFQVDGVVFPGGHDKAIKPYLESEVLRAFVRQLFTADGKAKLPVAAICHGVLVLARTKNEQGVSVVYGRQLTSLPWAFERKAWQLGKIIRFWDPNYYRTYVEVEHEPAGFWGVQQELTRLVGAFSDVPKGSVDYLRKTSGLHRDTLSNERAAWVVQDDMLVTARWPGDAHTFVQQFSALVTLYRTRLGKVS